MSEQFKQDTGSQSSEIEDDPLAELARIVAGEPELRVPAQAPVVEEHTLIEPSVEAALEEQLMQEFSQAEADLPEPLLEPASFDEIEAPAFVDDINSSIEQITNEQPHVEPAMPEPIMEEPVMEDPVLAENIQPPIHQEAVAVNPEVGFQDGLISALEMEIGGNSVPETETVVEEPVFQPEVDHSMMDASVDNSAAEVEAQVESMQETLEQELAMQFEPAEPFVEPALEQASVIAEQPTASIEDDLGAAFANEFEQISSQQDVPTSDTFVVEEPVVAQVAVSQTMEQASVVPVTGDPSLEMDFEAAFAQELEEISVPETQGWAETDTAEANSAFATAASSTVASANVADPAVNLEASEYDPGHVGSIDEITSVDASVAVANDNGGGKKYAVAALVIALFAGAIAAGYGFLGGTTSTVATGTPEIIKADADPIKVKPKDPGGLVPENQDNASYGDLGGENNVAVSQQTLNSQTEEPLVLNTGNSAELPKSGDRLSSSDDTGATPNANGSSVLPKVVQTVVVKPDGTIIAKPAVPKPVETALNNVTIGNTANVEVKPVSTQVIKKPVAIDGAKAATGDITIPVASPLPKPVVVAKPAPVKVAAAPKPKKVAPPPARKSEWVVQVSSQRTPEAAQSSFSTMRNKFSALQGRAMSIQRANVNGTTYYRVRVQTASRDDANKLCSSLASAGGNCFVTK